MRFLVKLIKTVSFLAICSLLLDELGQIDLASLGVNGELKDKIEMVLHGKEVLEKVVALVPLGKAVSERSTEIRLVAATPGIVLVLIEGILSLLKFLISVGILVAAVSMAFAYIQNIPTAPTGPTTSRPMIVEQYSLSPGWFPAWMPPFRRPEFPRPNRR